MRKLSGQSMVEYTIVTAAFVTGLLVLNDGACPDEYEDCVEYLLTVMHDNADGYSNSITALHDYGPSLPAAGRPRWDDEEVDSGSGGGGGGGAPLPEPQIGQSTLVTDGYGMIHGVLNNNNEVVSPDGFIVGIYNSVDNTFTPTDGVATGARTHEVVTDEANNVLQMQAVVDCNSDQVYGFGYKSKVSDKFVTSLNMAEADVSNYCLAPAYAVTTRTGSADGGRIVNGRYYAIGLTAVLAPVSPVGEVVYWPELNDCVAMATGWDQGIDADLSAEERYAEQLLLYGDTNPATSPYLGRLSPMGYVEQLVDGQGAWPNDCVSVRTVSAP